MSDHEGRQNDESSQPSSPSGDGTSRPSGQSSSSRPSGQSQQTGSSSDNTFQLILNHYTVNKLDALMMITRLCTILFSLSYLLPFGCGVSCFRKAVIANAATSALRLHQRLPSFQMTAEYLAQLMLEDSCHYLLFSVIFLYSHPITLVLLPLALFATLHVSSNALVLMDRTNTRTSGFGIMLSSFVEKYQKTILLLVAISEVMLMPIVILAVFTGVVTLVTPFIYYRFLSLRYSSRRNPYTRQVFRTLRVTLEQVALLPQTPQFARGLIRSAVDFTSRLAPATAPAN